MKKIAVGIAVVLGLTLLAPASAEVKPSIAIIDTAIDTTLPALQGKIIYEACVMQSKGCPNKQMIQEGPGSASLPASQLYANGFDHGTIMALIATQVNPDINIVFIRIVPMAANGRQSQYTESSVLSALEWVAQNKQKFNIVATSASIGHHNLRTGANYCPVRANLRDSIVKLQSINVATIFAAGNNYDINRVDYPSCITEAIAVGSATREGRIALHSNGGKELDFYALGSFETSVKNAVGTSAATAALASYWVKNYKGSYASTYDYLKSISKPTESEQIKSNNFIDILK